MATASGTAAVQAGADVRSVTGRWGLVALLLACCTKRLVGTVSGIQNFGGNVAGIIAPWVTGAIAHRTGSFATAFVVCGLSSLAARSPTGC